MRTSRTSLSKKKDVLSMRDLSAKEIADILRLAIRLKTTRNVRQRPLAGKTLGMVFQKPSTRTRLSFEVAMYELGGAAIHMSKDDTQLSRGESIEDTARTLSLYLDCIMARVYDHSDVERIAQFASVPVINGLSDLFHPCQILADLMTIKERKGKLGGLKIAWLGDGDNVCNDLLIGSSKTGISVVVACPKGYEPDSEVLGEAQKIGRLTNAEISVTQDAEFAAKDADILMTDTFVSIGKENERGSREAAFLPMYQVNDHIMNLARQDAIFMHCLPAKRGQEVSASVIDGEKSAVWQEAENRLHVQKALLCHVLGKHRV